MNAVPQLDPQFDFDVEVNGDVLQVEVRGRLDAEMSAMYLNEIASSLEIAAMSGPKNRARLIFVDKLTWFATGAAARAHGAWFFSHRDLIAEIAIVSDKNAMRFAASTGALISRKPIKVYDDLEAALAAFS